MIGLYYTGATQYLDPQQDSKLSLGGFVSSSLVPNNLLNNLFGNISALSVSNDTTIIRGIALKNETGLDINQLTLFFNYPLNPFYVFEVAVVSVGVDRCKHFFMERVNNENATPYIGSFSEADGVNNSINIGALPTNNYMGLWIRAKINPIVSQQTNCQFLYDSFINNTPIQPQQSVDLVLDYN